MMKQRKILPLGKKLYLTLFTASSLFANSSYYTEIDPMGYALGGYSLHVGKQVNSIRLDLGVFGLDIPDSFEKNMYDSEDFNIEFNGYGIKLDYFIQENIFIGLDSSFQTRKYTHRTTNTTIKKDVNYLGVRTGLNYNITKNLYLSPWVGVWKNISGNEKITVGNSSVETGEYDFFATMHIGYRF